ncbi:MAG: hypothetical protein ACP5QI_03385, partial [Candidatus Bathyarchaeia archaeon]
MTGEAWMKPLTRLSKAMFPLSLLGSREMNTVLKIATAALKSMVDLLVRKGFYWILPVVLAKSTDPF